MKEFSNLLKGKIFTKTGTLNKHICKEEGFIKSFGIENYNLLLEYTDFLDELNPSISQRIYHIYNDVFYIKRCKTCNNPLEYCRFTYGYRTYCSKECVDRKEVSIKVKIPNLERYGVESTLQVQEFREKGKETNINKYGVDCILKLPEFHIESKETKKERYGDENYNNREQFKETNLEKYGAISYSQTPDYIEIAKNRIEETQYENAQLKIDILNEFF